MVTKNKPVVTKELILKLYEYKQKFSDKITNVELGKLLGISETTVRNILKGDYDHLLKEEESKKEKTQIDSLSKSLGNISEQLSKMNNGIQFDHTELGNLLEDILNELQSVGDLLHIIAVYHMRHETDKVCKTKMANQIQHCHSNKRISDATKK